MKLKLLIKKIKLKNLFLIGTLLINSFNLILENGNRAIAGDEKQLSNESYIRNIPKNKFYILGPGDKLYIEVTKAAKDINQIISIDGEGIANLNRLDRIYISGLTIQELTEILNEEYSKYVYNPKVKITVIEHRPVKFFIDGEVTNTGFNVLPGGINIDTFLKSYKDGNYGNYINEEEKLLNNQGVSQQSFKTIFPTLVDAIRKSGGLTDRADLENIEITRINSISSGGGKIKTNVNLLKSLELQASNQNIRIMDGDTISIKRSEKKSLIQISKIFKSNLNPREITVYVGGRVERVGPLTLTKQASLNDALNISGLNIIKGPISFIREGSEGILDKRLIRYSKKAEKGSYKNPYLNEGDIIYAGKNSFNIASEIINELTSPIQGLVSIYGLYKVFED